MPKNKFSSHTATLICVIMFGRTTNLLFGMFEPLIFVPMQLSIFSYLYQDWSTTMGIYFQELATILSLVSSPTTDCHRQAQWWQSKAIYGQRPKFKVATGGKSVKETYIIVDLCDVLLNCPQMTVSLNPYFFTHQYLLPYLLMLGNHWKVTEWNCLEL